MIDFDDVELDKQLKIDSVKRDEMIIIEDDNW